ncbi:nitric oxide-associated protein 1 isoform X1 [Stigmatopora argus]
MLMMLRVTASLGRAIQRSPRCGVSFVGTKAALGRARGGGRRELGPSCTVEPNREETFLFADYTDAGEEPKGADPPPPTVTTGSWRRPRAGAKSLDDRKKKAVHKIAGTADPEEPVCNSHCSGCGAVLHCTDAAVPGYLPGEKYKSLLLEGGLESATCQRCHLLRHHQKAVDLSVTKEEFRDTLRQVRQQRGLVLLVADLLDLPDSLIPDLPDLVGSDKNVVVLGNKIDAIPADSPDYLKRIRRRLAGYCEEAGYGARVTDVRLVSAKSGYGLEALISVLQRTWRYKGDVYLVGAANAGKSTLFNALLRSDYCKAKAVDVFGEATVSPFPGTTLNLLKFPIINPTGYRMLRRDRRLARADDGASPGRAEDPADIRRRGYLQGHVGRTFLPRVGRKTITFDPGALSFGEDDNDDGKRSATAGKASSQLTYKELKYARWLFDTPGIAKEHDILDLLNEREVKAVVPRGALVPRTLTLKVGMCLYVGALARIDYLEGKSSCWFSVIANHQIPLHVCPVEKADAVYQKHAGRKLLGVPSGGAERMKNFPPLVPRDFQLEGRGRQEAAADILLSSAGWVAVTAREGQRPLLRVHGPAGVTFGLRTPPLLPGLAVLKRARRREDESPIETANISSNKENVY